MSRPILAAALILLAPACTHGFAADPGLNVGVPVAAARTEAGQTLIVAWRAFDTLLDAVELAHAAGALPAGSAKALRVADSVDRTRTALNAATDAVRIGDAGGFSDAISHAEGGLAAARSALGG